MIFNSNILGNSALFMFYVGLCMGVLYETLLFLRKLTNNSKIVTCISDIVFATAFISVFIFGIQFCNYGKFRVFLLATYIFAFFVERATLGNLVAKFINFIYNLYIKLYNKFIKRLHNDRKKT